MNNSQLIENSKSAARNLSFNDPREAAAKFAIFDLSDRLSDHEVRIHDKADGYLMVTGRGRCRFLTRRESLVWRFLGLPPAGHFCARETPKAFHDNCGND